jgi:hypothetical protein
MKTLDDLAGDRPEMEVRIRVVLWRSGRATAQADVCSASSPTRRPSAAAVARWEAALARCAAAGLELPDDPQGALPAGIGAVANEAGLSRQAFTEQVRRGLRHRAEAAGLNPAEHLPTQGAPQALDLAIACTPRRR